MSTSLSKLIDNLPEGLHNDECKDCQSYLDYLTIRDNKLIFRCFRCKKNYEKNFNKDLIHVIDLQIHMNFAMEILTNLFCY